MEHIQPISSFTLSVYAIEDLLNDSQFKIYPFSILKLLKIGIFLIAHLRLIFILNHLTHFSGLLAYLVLLSVQYQ